MDNKYNIKEGDFINILSPMVQKLKLSGNNLLVFALIHGFSKDEEHVFHGSISYISQWLNISKNAVIDTIKVLVDSEYITKNEIYKNSVKFCEYKSNYENLIKKIDSGCEIALVVAKKTRGGTKSQLGSCEIAPNNNIDNNINKDSNTYCIENSPIYNNNADEWKHDYTAYKQLICNAADTLKSDAEFKSKQETYFPNINYELSIEKGCDYWLSEQGYKKCKQAKSKINMLSRLKNNFDKNRIYNSYGRKQQTSMFREEEINKDKLIINGTEYK